MVSLTLVLLGPTCLYTLSGNAFSDNSSPLGFDLRPLLPLVFPKLLLHLDLTESSAFISFQAISSIPSPWNNNLLPHEYDFGFLSFFCPWTLAFNVFLYLMLQNTSDSAPWKMAACLGEKKPKNLSTHGFSSSFALKFFCIP